MNSGLTAEQWFQRWLDMIENRTAQNADKIRALELSRGSANKKSILFGTSAGAIIVAILELIKVII